MFYLFQDRKNGINNGDGYVCIPTSEKNDQVALLRLRGSIETSGYFTSWRHHVGLIRIRVRPKCLIVAVSRDYIQVKLFTVENFQEIQNEPLLHSLWKNFTSSRIGKLSKW